MKNNLFWSWGIFNLFIGVWEIYAFSNRDKLLLSSDSIWEKINNGITTFKTFWIDAWIEYCKVDSRYIKHYSFSQYVWMFELLNFILATLFLLILSIRLIYKNNYKYIKILKLILFLSILNCVIYFISLFIEIYKYKKILDNIKKYASRYNLIIYYFISSIWLTIPILLYLQI